MLNTNEAIEIIKATATCLEFQLESKCEHPEECDGCDLCYRQGTAGQQIEAFKYAAEIMERLKKEVTLYGKN